VRFGSRRRLGSGPVGTLEARFGMYSNPRGVQIPPPRDARSGVYCPIRDTAILLPREDASRPSYAPAYSSFPSPPSSLFPVDSRIWFQRLSTASLCSWLFGFFASDLWSFELLPPSHPACSLPRSKSSGRFVPAPVNLPLCVTIQSNIRAGAVDSAWSAIRINGHGVSLVNSN